MPQKQPANSHSVIPYYIIKDADKAIEFYKDVFKATLEFRLDALMAKSCTRLCA